MKKLTKEQTKIFSIVMLIVSIITLGITIFGLVKTIKKRKTVETSTAEDILNVNELESMEEISIENLIEEENKITENKTNQSTSSSSNNVTPNTKNTYYIKVNYGANVVTIYTKDSNGNFTVPYKAMICSTGTATPRSGVYTIKSRWRWLGLIGNVYGQYSTQIVGNILFHSVPYTSKNSDALEYWEYDKLGTACSAGCIRLKVSDALWIYNNIPRGTQVEFYSSSDPGPLGKPSAQKISGNAECRNWDPTDPADGNPWRKNPVEEPTEKPIEKEPEKVTPEPVAPEPTIPDPAPVNNTTTGESNTTIENNTISNNVIENNVTENNVSNNTIENETEINNVALE